MEITKEQWKEYCAFINFEMDRLKGYESNSLVVGLIKRYQSMKERWKKRLGFTKQQPLAD